MGNFKVGDTVKLTHDVNHRLFAGTTGNVLRVDREHDYIWYLVDFGHTVLLLLGCDLELIKNKLLKFKVGDKVEVISNNCYVTIGSVGEIIRIDEYDDYIPYQVEFNFANNTSQLEWLDENEIELLTDDKFDVTKHTTDELVTIMNDISAELMKRLNNLK